MSEKKFDSFSNPHAIFKWMMRSSPIILKKERVKYEQSLSLFWISTIIRPSGILASQKQAKQWRIKLQ
jgi:hypothetical protein